jgi:hypothetical protein
MFKRILDDYDYNIPNNLDEMREKVYEIGEHTRCGGESELYSEYKLPYTTY